MMRRAAQHGSRRWASGRMLLHARVMLLAMMLVAGLGMGSVCAQSTTATPAANPIPAATPTQTRTPTTQPQSTTPMPRTAVAVPPLPRLAAGSTPSVAQSQSPVTPIVLPKLPGMPAVEGTKVDRVVAIVNGQLILDSDVDREQRFAALLPYGETSGPYSREAAIERLINRDLILQQLELQPQDEISIQAAAKDLNGLRTSLPRCKEFHCETQAGWEKFLATEGFTEDSLTRLWRQRMEVMAFIEMRFRMGIKISTPEIQEYYAKTLLPQYAAQHVTPPPVRAISSRIQEVLLQEQVSKLLDDWLESLRAQGDVVVRHPGEEAP